MTHIKEIVNDSTRSTNEKIINVLMEMGIPASLNGFDHLRTAITLLIEEPQAYEYNTQLLINEVAKRVNASYYSVDRRIRHAVSVGLERGNQELWEDVFRNSTKSSGSVFISTFIHRIKIIVSEGF